MKEGPPIDHDQLFKELLTHFFVEFVELFLPDVAGYMDRGAVEFLDKEVFTDVTAGDRHEVDLVAKTKYRGEAAFFLIHVENQSHAEPAFAKRSLDISRVCTNGTTCPSSPWPCYPMTRPSVPSPIPTVLSSRASGCSISRLPSSN